MIQDFIYPILVPLLLGGIGGLLAGMLGIGGGIIYVLIFSYYLERLGLSSEIIVPAIVANSMFAIMFAGLSGTYKQWKHKNFYPRSILTIGISASFAAIFFSYIISIGTWYTKERFTLFFIILLIFIAWRIFRSKNYNPVQDDEQTEPWKFILTGLLSGTIAAFSGIGGGVIIVPILTNTMNLPMRKATSISLGVISVMALLTSLYNLFFQGLPEINVDSPHIGLIFLSVSIPVAIGSLLFSPIGVNISNKLKASTIKTIFVGFLCIVIVKMIYGIIG